MGGLATFTTCLCNFYFYLLPVFILSQLPRTFTFVHYLDSFYFLPAMINFHSLPGFVQILTSVLQCFSSVSPVFTRFSQLFNQCLQLFQKCFKTVSKVLQKYFKSVSKVFQSCL